MKHIYAKNGGIELLKWVGLILMTGDHINKYLFNATLPVLFEAGRLCLPIFMFVLAYNVARPGAYEAGVYKRTAIRLFIFGALASAPFIYLGGLYRGWWPLNVLFTLLTFVLTAFLIEKGGIYRAYAALVFVAGGSMVEYWWPAVAFGLFCWCYIKTPSWWALAGALAACALLSKINGNHWALLALPLIIITINLDIKVNRSRWVFYYYYPVHLCLIALARIPMSRAGYLFF